MVEDHFAHSRLPPRPPSKRPLQIIIVVVVLISAAALAVAYGPMLSASPTPMRISVNEPQQKVQTVEPITQSQK